MRSNGGQRSHRVSVSFLTVVAALMACRVAAHGSDRGPRAAPGESSTQSVAFISEIAGRWLAEDKGRGPLALKVGAGVPGGSRIRPASPQPQDRITIVYLYERPPIACTCSEPGPCEPPAVCACDTPEPCRWPIEIAGPFADRPIAMRLWPAVKRFFSQPRGTFTAVVSRGGGALEDGVARYADGKLDLRDVFRGMADGDYALRIEPIRRAGPAATPGAGSIAFEWKAGSAVPLALDGLSPDLYRVSLLDPGTREKQGAADAWVLIADASHYEPARAAYEAARNVTLSWSDTVRRSTARGVLRAYLELLADPDLGR